MVGRENEERNVDMGTIRPDKLDMKNHLADASMDLWDRYVPAWEDYANGKPPAAAPERHAAVARLAQAMAILAPSDGSPMIFRIAVGATLASDDRLGARSLAARYVRERLLTGAEPGVRELLRLDPLDDPSEPGTMPEEALDPATEAWLMRRLRGNAADVERLFSEHDPLTTVIDPSVAKVIRYALGAVTTLRGLASLPTPQAVPGTLWGPGRTMLLHLNAFFGRSVLDFIRSAGPHLHNESAQRMGAMERLFSAFDAYTPNPLDAQPRRYVEVPWEAAADFCAFFALSYPTPASACRRTTTRSMVENAQALVDRFHESFRRQDDDPASPDEVTFRWSGAEVEAVENWHTTVPVITPWRMREAFDDAWGARQTDAAAGDDGKKSALVTMPRAVALWTGRELMQSQWPGVQQASARLNAITVLRRATRTADVGKKGRR